MKVQIKVAIQKALAKMTAEERTFHAADELAARLKESTTRAKQAFKDARRAYKQVRRNARLANRERKLAKKDFEKASAILKRLQKKVRPQKNPKTAAS